MDKEITALLPAGWTLDEETEEDKLQNQLPKGWKLDDEENPSQFRDVVKEEQQKAGIEEDPFDTSDLERAGEFGTAEATRGLFSGATFGLTENVPGLKTGENIAATTGKVIGSFLPLSKLINVFKGPAMKLAAKSPVFQKQLGALATMFGVGVTSKSLETIAKGEMPSADDVLEHGLEWAVLDGLLQTAGFGGRFAKALFTRSKATGIGRKDLVNQVTRELGEAGVDMNNAEAVSQKALEILERPISEAEQAVGKQIQLKEKPKSEAANVAQEALKQEPVTPKDLKTRKVTDEPINRLTSDLVVLAEPYQPEGINFTQEAETLGKDAIAEQIESVGTRAASEEELGNSIREDIETELETAKKEYRPLYITAEEEAQDIQHIPKNTGKEAGNKLIKMSKLKTKPAGYDAVLKILENVLEDVGFIVQKEEGVITDIISSESKSVGETIELARRLNEIVDYEAVEPSVKDALKSVVKAAKADIRVGLKANPDALAAFELAEAEHARVAKKFSKDSIRKIRGNQAGEKISKMAEASSTFGDLKQVLSPTQMLQVEREMLEKLNNQSFEKAQKSLREMERHLSAENKKIARDIVEAKNPHNPLARKKLTQDAILNDMSNSLTNGTRPTKTLELWKTPKGQKLVKETFHNSPNWPAVKGYLEKQSFNDMVSSVLKDGKLDLKKFKSFMKDPATVNNIRNQGGEEAVNFFRELDGKVKQLQENAKLLDKLPTKGQIKKGKKFVKQSPGQRRLEKGVEKSQRVERETGKQGQEKLKPREKVDKQHREAQVKRGNEILERMSRKDYPLNSKINDWKKWVSDFLGLNAQAAMNVFGVAKLGGAALGTYVFGVPTAVASVIGYKLMNKMMTSPRVRKAFIEAAKHQSDSLKFILAMEQLGEVMDEE